MTWRLDDMLADELRAALLEYTFERRTLADLMPQMQAAGDETSLERTRATCKALEALGRHILPALSCPDAIDCCCLLAWYWNFERPAFAQLIDDGGIASASLTAADYTTRWKRLAKPIEAILAAYPELVRQALNNRAGA